MITSIKSGDWVRFWKIVSQTRRTYHIGYVEKVGENVVAVATVGEDGITYRYDVEKRQIVEVLDYQQQVLSTLNLWIVGEYDEDSGMVPIETVLRGQDVPKKGYEVAYVSGHENALAIAALPNLLHVLLDVRDCLIAIQPWGMDDLLQKVNEALSSAGYWSAVPSDHVVFHYRYCSQDGGREHSGIVILSNPDNLDRMIVEAKMMASCKDGKFIAQQMGIQSLLPSEWVTTSKDHKWHEFRGLSLTKAPITDSRTLKEFMDQFIQCEWNEKEAVSP